MQRSIPIVTTLILDMKFSDNEELRKAAHMLSLFPNLRNLRIWVINLLSFSDICILYDLFTVSFNHS